MTFAKQLGIYAISIFLPPFGLTHGIRYLFQKDPKVKMVGAIAIVLTVLSVSSSIYFTLRLLSQISKTVGNPYQILGF